MTSGSMMILDLSIQLATLLTERGERGDPVVTLEAHLTASIGF